MVVDLQKLAKKVDSLKAKKEKKSSKITKPITSKSVLKKSNATITIQNNKPAEYVPVYFSNELKQTKEESGSIS